MEQESVSQGLKIISPCGDREDFLKSQRLAVDGFSKNGMIAKLKAKNIKMVNYHNLLLTLFHQTYFGPSTFALAAAHCDSRLFQARDYLIRHADEEKEHWMWVISDLQNTGYTGVDPRSQFPALSTQSYVAYAFFLAQKYPIARLAMASVLEGIGGQFGKTYGRDLCEQLSLTSEQAKFFLMHGDLDTGHSEEIIALLSGLDLTPYDWAHLSHTANITGTLYKRMYDESAGAP